VARDFLYVALDLLFPSTDPPGLLQIRFIFLYRASLRSSLLLDPSNLREAVIASFSPRGCFPRLGNFFTALWEKNPHFPSPFHRLLFLRQLACIPVLRISPVSFLNSFRILFFFFVELEVTAFPSD